MCQVVRFRFFFILFSMVCFFVWMQKWLNVRVKFGMQGLSVFILKSLWLMSVVKKRSCLDRGRMRGLRVVMLVLRVLFVIDIKLWEREMFNLLLEFFFWQMYLKFLLLEFLWVCIVCISWNLDLDKVFGLLLRRMVVFFIWKIQFEMSFDLLLLKY